MTQTEDFSVEDALRILRTAIEREKHIEKLRDNLTQLGNHEALGGWLAQQIDKQSTFWLAFFEVDRFKDVNDQFGYPNANLLLQKIARYLNDTAKDFFTSETSQRRITQDAARKISNPNPTNPLPLPTSPSKLIPLPGTLTPIV